MTDSLKLTPADVTPDTVIDRIRYLIQLSNITQNAFAHRLGIDPGNMSKHLNGKLPVTEGLINRIVVEMGVSKKWLKEGLDVPFPKPIHAAEIKDGHTIIQHRNVPGGTPIYDIDATAGFGELSMMFTEDNIVGMIALPQVPENTRIVRVSGNSMEPNISHGDYVAIRELSGTRNIFWGQIYVVVLDDYRMVKVIRRHRGDTSKVILHSFNEEYDDMEVERTDIRALYLVEAIISCKVLN